MRLSYVRIKGSDNPSGGYDRGDTPRAARRGSRADDAQRAAQRGTTQGAQRDDALRAARSAGTRRGAQGGDTPQGSRAEDAQRTEPQRGAPRADTREQLLAAARDSVRRNGLRGATSRDITATAGANLQSITYHFGSKDDLIAAALFDEIERRVRPALDAFDGEVPATQALLGVVQQLVVEFERNQRDAVVYLEALLLATHDAGYRRRAVKLVGTIRTRLATLVEELRRDGIVPAWVDAAAMSSLVLAVANGIVLQTALEPRGPGLDAMAGQFAGLLMAAAQAG